MAATFVKFQANALVLLLRSPELGNTFEPNNGVKKHLSMAGKAWTYIAPATSVTHTLQFKAITRAKSLEARNFIRLTAGQPVVYTDWNGQIWRGRILTSQFAITASGICDDNFSIQFEGNKANA